MVICGSSCSATENCKSGYICLIFMLVAESTLTWNRRVTAPRPPSSLAWCWRRRRSSLRQPPTSARLPMAAAAALTFYFCLWRVAGHFASLSVYIVISAVHHVRRW